MEIIHGDDNEFSGKLVCVVTFDRKDCIDRWLRAWNSANKYGAKIAVLHACLGEVPDEDQKSNILKHNPDFYVPFFNTKLRDMEALIMVLQNRAKLPEWKYLFWFTDDMLPMRREFIKPFVEKIQIPNVGLVAQCYEPKTIEGRGAHIRTVAYAITRDVASRIKFPQEGPEEHRPYLFEHGKIGVYEDHILNQVLSMGYDFKLCHSEPESKKYLHWTSFLDWMWDCHLLGHWEEYWKVYEDQFNMDKWEGVSVRKETVLSVRQCEDYANMPNKVCSIIPTSVAHINYLLWSIFSLLLRSDSDVLHHIIVGINGPDSRTGDPGLQDLKQRFLEELRNLKWQGRDMPITIVRTWSRIGHAQTIEQCICWVHTEFYISMHDDVIIIDKKWQERMGDFKIDKRLAINNWGKFFSTKLKHKNDINSLDLPHVNSTFSICKKSILREINASWIGYHLPMKFKIGNFVNYDEFIKFHKENNSLAYDLAPMETIPKEDAEFDIYSMDIGGNIFIELVNNDYNYKEFYDESIVHFVAKSWGTKMKIDNKYRKEIFKLEEDLKKIPEYYNLYIKYKKSASMIYMI